MSEADTTRIATALVTSLDSYRGQRPVVLALSERQLGLASAVSDGLGGEAGLLRSRCVDPGGGRPPGFVWETGQLTFDFGPAPEDAAEREFAARIVDALRTMLLDTADRPDRAENPDTAGRPAIVVSEGVASGAGLVAALRALKAGTSSKVVAAVAAASKVALARIRKEIKDVVCLRCCDTRREVARSCRAFRRRDHPTRTPAV